MGGIGRFVSKSALKLQRVYLLGGDAGRIEMKI